MGNDMDEDVRHMAKEIQIAAGVNLPEKTVLELGALSPFTCPECKGALIRMKEGKLFRFRCHTGHGFTADALLEGLMETLSEFIWQTTRGFQEASMLLEHIGHHMLENGETVKAKLFLGKALELNQRASGFQRIAISDESLSTENIEQQRPADDS